MLPLQFGCDFLFPVTVARAKKQQMGFLEKKKINNLAGSKICDRGDGEMM